MENVSQAIFLKNRWDRAGFYFYSGKNRLGEPFFFETHNDFF